MSLRFRYMARIIFVTGTDTGAGKTLLTGLLLQHFRTTGVHALAMKPFCSGGTGDVDFLSAIQNHELSVREMNPFYFPEPVAPLVSARKHGRKIGLKEAVKSIRRVAKRCECLIVEGSGGLRVPLGENFDVAKLIKRLNCEVIVAARNQLGVINHTLLTVDALRNCGVQPIKIVLMGTAKKKISTRTNAGVLSELLGKTRLFSLNYLGQNPMQIPAVENIQKKIKKTLAQILS